MARRKGCAYCYHTLNPHDKNPELRAIVACTRCKTLYHAVHWRKIADTGCLAINKKNIRCGNTEAKSVSIRPPDELKYKSVGAIPYEGRRVLVKKPPASVESPPPSDAAIPLPETAAPATEPTDSTDSFFSRVLASIKRLWSRESTTASQSGSRRSAWSMWAGVWRMALALPLLTALYLAGIMADSVLPVEAANPVLTVRSLEWLWAISRNSIETELYLVSQTLDSDIRFFLRSTFLRYGLPILAAALVFFPHIVPDKSRYDSRGRRIWRLLALIYGLGLYYYTLYATLDISLFLFLRMLLIASVLMLLTAIVGAFYRLIIPGPAQPLPQPSAARRLIHRVWFFAWPILLIAASLMLWWREIQIQMPNIPARHQGAEILLMAGIIVGGLVFYHAPDSKPVEVKLNGWLRFLIAGLIIALCWYLVPRAYPENAVTMLYSWAFGGGLLTLCLLPLQRTLS